MAIAKTQPKDDLTRNERMDHLRSQCSHWRPHLAETFEIVNKHARYIAATDGYGLVMLRAESGETTARRFDHAAEAIGAPGEVGWRAVSFLDFWRWLASPGERCGACGGTGYLPMYGYAAFSMEGNGPEHDLFEHCGCLNPGSVFGVTINRRLLLEKIGPLAAPDTGIEVVGNKDTRCVGVRAGMRITEGSDLVTPDWLIVVMGLDQQGDPRTPAFMES